MLSKLVQQEAAQGCPSPLTDYLLRSRPVATSMEFMLWVAQQEAGAPPGPEKEVGGGQGHVRAGLACRGWARHGRMRVARGTA